MVTFILNKNNLILILAGESFYLFIYLFIYEFLSKIASSVLKVNCYQ